MADDLSEHLNTIRLESSKLNEAADRLTNAIRVLNDQLASMNVGVSTYCTDEFFEASSDYGSGETVPCRYYIGYDRDQNGSWSISVMCRNDVLDLMGLPKNVIEKHPEILTGTNTIRWVKSFDACPRNVRLSLARFVPKVVEGLATSVRRIAEGLDQSLASIEALDLDE